VENDHKFIKSKSCYCQWYQSFITAKRTIDGIETLRLIQKGQVCYIAKNNIYAQNNFISQLFGLAA
jgi:transposase-like protein